ncbi:transglycosylase domain-containing protein [Lishizhenia sp.]|uniref:transglycosylase domain-containing protein n=1 Tax=Lishizhenia sp. TaxID=2497594 RepID=UPI00299F220D|nr:transglycosylase domain-containing protein [Lishizhenia sp.]MDX1445182.1 transglycosylase domain-containing protein [Lishizhenia sp.]
MAKAKKEKQSFTFKTKLFIYLIIWLGAMLPLLGILYLRYIVTDEEDLPSVAMLENPPELLATDILADDGETSLGKFWKINRTSVTYNEISPYVISALISTEDERYQEHSGIDAKAVGRALANMGKAGGASTISQQLAKLIFTLAQRDKERAAALLDDPEKESKREVSGLEGRLYEKVQENIIALRLEEKYTKEEIITMYLNQFDFLYNAVGIASASKVYFDCKPKDLTKEQAAMLVGMCKNPSLYNPHSFNVRNYKKRYARYNNIDEGNVTDEQARTLFVKDSMRAVNRRNTVLDLWRKNSRKGNEALTATIDSDEERDSLQNLNIVTDYQRVDHKEGIATYFRETLRKEVQDVLRSKDENGDYIYAKADGTPFNIYEDGLKIYTTINADLQKHAEHAVHKHLSETLQREFTKNNKRTRHFPFSNRLTEDQIDRIVNSAMKRSERYKMLKANGLSHDKIVKKFNEPTEMTVFSWKGDIDTVMSPLDSILYYKNFLQAGMISIQPQTGFVKAWVGGTDLNHFAYDHVKQGKRQVGSTIKPFVYSAAMRFGVVNKCTTFPNIAYCVDVTETSDPDKLKSWCPGNSGADLTGEPITVGHGIANSMNNITVAVMSKMGGTAGPQAVAKLMEDLNITLRKEDIVPAMCLGVMDLSLFELVAAQATFVNKGIYNAPTILLRIEDRNGNTIYEAQPNSKEAMSEELAYATLSLMKDVVQKGTGASLRGSYWPWGGITYPTAGKTGTTQNNSDGWFMGLTPDLATGVWVGAEDRGVHFRSMQWGQGARMALPIYGYYMQKVYKDPKIKISKEDFEMPINYQNSVYNCSGENNNNGPGESSNSDEVPDLF